MRPYMGIIARLKTTPFIKVASICCAMIFTSCSFEPVEAIEEPKESTTHQIVEPMGLSFVHGLQGGLGFEFRSLDFSIPGKEGFENSISLRGGSGQIQLDSASLHGLSLQVDLPLDYNDLYRELNLSLLHDQLYFSLDAGNNSSASYDLKYVTGLEAFDYGGIDETTHGISYFEYGDLDYIIEEILGILEIEHITLANGDTPSSIIVDWDAVLDSLDNIEEYDASRFLWTLPIGDKTFEIGLCHKGDYVLSSLEFPMAKQGNQDYVSLTDSLGLRFQMDLKPNAATSWTLPYPESDYEELIDSLDLFRQIATYAKRKAFGIDASFTLSHTEDEIVGDDEHFAKDAVSEGCFLNLDAMLDFSSSSLGGVHAGVEIGQEGGSTKDILLHTETDDDTTGTNFYLNVNDILKISTRQDIASALLSTLTDSLGDESIQNDTIKKLLVSVLSTIDGIADALDAIQGSSIYKNIDEQHYEDVISTITQINTSTNSILISIDLSQANMDGVATVTLNGTSMDAPLGNIHFDHVGLRGENDSHTSLHLDGTLEIIPYEKPIFSAEGYEELTHLPGWDEEIKAIAERDQLQVQLEGYILKTGTTSPIVTSAPYSFGRKEQGFSFKGSLAFDLAQKIGTGQMVFTDRKENYINDHSLKIDFTGEGAESDTDLNDMKGSGNVNAMFFEYNSQNTIPVSDSGDYKDENRKEPTNKNGLKGRFSVHSIGGVLGVINELTSSTDVRFERLTNLVSSLSAETLLTKLLNGEYFEFLSSKILSKAEIGTNESTFEIAPGVIQPNHGLTIKLGYDADSKPKTIEVWTTLDNDSQSEIYVKISLGSTAFDTFPFQFSDHSFSAFTDYSSMKTLLEFLLGTISIGMTDDTLNSYTTYHLKGNVDMKLLGGLYDISISMDIYIFLKGTTVKILGSVYVPEKIVTNGETTTNIFYETTGSDASGQVYLHRLEKNSGIFGLGAKVNEEHVRVKGEDFSANLMDWLLKYILNFRSMVTDRIGSDTGSSTEAFHGEDIIKDFAVKNTSLSEPTWSLNIGLDALAHVRILNDLSVAIAGKTVSYTGSDKKSYTRKALYSLTGNTSILGSIIKATLNFSVENIKTGSYQEAWYSDSSAYLYYNQSKTLTKRTGTANSLWNGSYGATNSNSNYRNATWKAKP